MPSPPAADVFSVGAHLTRRAFTGRAVVLAIGLATSSLLERAAPAGAQFGSLPFPTRQTYEALLQVIVPNEPLKVSMAVSRFDTEYGGYEPEDQQAVVNMLNLVETAAPGGHFSQLPLAQRTAFVEAETAIASDPLVLDLAAFHQAVDTAADQIRQAALLGPRGLAELAPLPGEDDGPLVLGPTPLTGYVPDFDQDFLQEKEPPVQTPAPATPLTSQQLEKLMIRGGIELSREAFSFTADDIEGLAA